MNAQTLSIAFLASLSTLFSQVPENGAATFSISYEGNATRFKAELPKLTPVPGAPPPFYSFHWEFGDGNFSNEESPAYHYAESRIHEAYLAATASYDDMTNPPGITSPIVPPTGFEPGKPDEFSYVFQKKSNALGLKTNTDARPNDEMVVIISYQNRAARVTDGQLFVFFNEEAYPKKHFEFRSDRTHFGETGNGSGLSFFERKIGGPLPGLGPVVGGGAPWMGSFLPFSPPNGTEWVKAARGSYRDERVWRFQNLAAGEGRNLFMTLFCTPEMLKDTTAMIHLKGIFLPDNALVQPEEFTLEIPIVASHDPNLIAVSDTRANFRHVRSKKLDYKVRFQNNGEGAAHKIELTVEVPKGLNLGKMRPVEWSPECPLCNPKGPLTGCLDTATADGKLVFTFQGVNLPGTRQKGVKDRESTKGFVKYRIEPRRQMPKRAFRSRAHIVFDKNPPISTNFSKTRFKPGVSPGLKGGVSFPPDDTGKRGWFAGASLSPYKSWRAYPQVEVLVGRGATQNGDFPTDSSVTHTLVTDLLEVDSFQFFTKIGSTRTSSFEVPVLLRKNFTRFFGMGIGGSAMFSRVRTVTGSETSTKAVAYHYSFDTGVKILTDTDEMLGPTNRKVEVSYKKRTRFSAFADMTIGAVRAGPNLGIRAGGVFDDGLQPFVQASLEVKF